MLPSMIDTIHSYTIDHRRNSRDQAPGIHRRNPSKESGEGIRRRNPAKESVEGRNPSKEGIRRRKESVGGILRSSIDSLLLRIEASMVELEDVDMEGKRTEIQIGKRERFPF
jgi:hypothetical protein